MAEVKRNEMLKKMKEMAVEIIGDSTCHGLPRMLKTSRMLLKIMWLLLSFGSIGGCCYVIVGMVNDYLSYDVTTRIRVKPLITIDFPQVTICNVNAFMTNTSHQFVDQMMAQYHVGDAFNSSLISQFLPTIYPIQQSLSMSNYLALLNARDPNRTDAFRKSLGYSLDELLVGCNVGGVECHLSNFVWYYDLMYGNCYTFNSGLDANGSNVPMLKISKPGLGNGLSIELFAGFDDYYTGLERTSGMQVFIHDQNDRFQLFQGIKIEKGKDTSVMIRKTVTTQMNYPYSDCESDYSKYDNEIFNRVMSLYPKYRRNVCFQMCFQKYTTQTCGCYDPNIEPMYPGTRQCTSFDDIFCDFGVFVALFTEKSIHEKCEPFCPLECDSVRYDLATTFRNYPTDTYAQKLMMYPVLKSKFARPEDYTVENVKKSLTSLNVFYGAIEYVQIDESAKMSMFDLVSNVGGILGLFLGLSFLSLAEFIEIIVELIMILFESNLKFHSVKPKKVDIILVKENKQRNKS